MDTSLSTTWPDDNILDSILSCESNSNYFQNSLIDYTTCSSSESDSSPSFYSSPFSSPIDSPEINISNSPPTLYQMENTNFQINSPLYNTQNVEEESLESIIQHIMKSNTNLSGYDCNLNGPSLKKRKFSELDNPLNCSQISFIDTISSRIIQGEKLILSRDQLLQLSSSEYDHYKKLLIAKYTLTNEETELLKKQRRIIKNREYSQTSRQKKRQKVKELEECIKTLENENNQLKSENQSLKQNLWKIIGAYKKTKQEKQVYDNTYSSDCILPPPSNSTTQKLNLFSINSPSIHKPTSKTTGACLFIFLLSFGFLFSLYGLEENQNYKLNNNNAFTSRTGRIVLSSDDEVSYSWWNLIINQISSSLNSLESQKQTETSLRFITTVTTNIDSSFINENSPPQSWDDTHVCDNESSIWHNKFFRQNETIYFE